VIDHRWQLGLLGWALAATLLTGLYLRQRHTRNATTVDAGWALSLAGIAVLDALLGPGAVSQRALIAVLAGLESLRLAVLVLRRARGGEDRRYRDLRARWAERGREQLSFAIFYQAQAAVAALLALPFVLACFNRSSRIGVVEWVGVALWLVAATGEAVADAQLARFVSHPANKGHTMQRGLWRYSRHPNYFFQTLTWLAYGLIAVSAPWGWLGFLSYAVILYLVLFVSGIPPAEQQSLRSRGDEFRAYRRRTSAFVPWFPSRTA
jgi:steroid 5-alpha reductase family enzyme